MIFNLLFIISLLFTCMNAQISENTQTKSIPLGVIIAVQGDRVEIHNNVNNTIKVAQNRDKVYADDIIKTTSDSSSKVLMFDNSVLNIGNNSSLKITRKISYLELIYGKIRCVVAGTLRPPDSTYEIRASHVTAGVRGTEFIINYKPDTDDIAVYSLKGTVALNNNIQEKENKNDQIIVTANTSVEFNISDLRAAQSEPEQPVTETESQNKTIKIKKKILDNKFKNKLIKDGGLNTGPVIPMGISGGFVFNDKRPGDFDKFNDFDNNFDNFANPIDDHFDNVRTDRYSEIIFDNLIYKGRVGF